MIAMAELTILRSGCLPCSCRVRIFYHLSGVFMRFWILIFLSFAVHKSLAQEKPCTPKSAIMSLAKSCYTGDMARIDTPGKFIEKIEGNPSYCYNALTFLTQEGELTRLEVLQDNPQGNYRNSVFKFNRKAVYNNEGKSVVVLKKLLGTCYPKESRECAGGYFSSKNADLPMALTLSADSGGFKVDGVTSNNDLIKNASKTAPEATGDFNMTKTTTSVYREIRERILKRSQLIVDTKQTPGKPITDVADYQDCVRQFNIWISYTQQNDQLKLKDPYGPADLALLGRVNAKIKSGNTVTSSAAPAKR